MASLSRTVANGTTAARGAAGARDVVPVGLWRRLSLEADRSVDGCGTRGLYLLNEKAHNYGRTANKRSDISPTKGGIHL